MSAPVAVDKELYVTSFGGVVYKLNQDDGTVLSAMRSRATSAPVVVGDHVFLTRRADGDKGDVGEAVAGDDRGRLKEVVAGEPEGGAVPGQEGAGSGRDQGQGGQAGRRQRLRRRLPASANPTAAYGNIGQSQRVVDAGVSGFADLELRRQELQLHGR